MQKSCFSERLREAINGSGMSQADLSRASGITEATISRYISGSFKEPSAAKLIALAKVLNTTPNELLGCSIRMESSKPNTDRPHTQILEQVRNIADRAICVADILRDDMTRPSYTDEYMALAICFGELCGMVRLIRDTAVQGIEGLQ